MLAYNSNSKNMCACNGRTLYCGVLLVGTAHNISLIIINKQIFLENKPVALCFASKYFGSFSYKTQPI